MSTTVKDIGKAFPIGAQVRYTPPGCDADLFMVKSAPWRRGDAIVIGITGFRHPVPVDQLTRDDGHQGGGHG